MEGIVHFKDGHKEQILWANALPNRVTGDKDIDFFTTSGEYAYRSYVEKIEYGFKIVKHEFLKRDGVDGKYSPVDIDFIQIN